MNANDHEMLEGPVAIEVDGVIRPVHNSQGKRIHVTKAGVVNFWRWFGNSQVIDALGRPLVMYHGTTVWEHEGKQLGDIQAFNRKATTEIVGRSPSTDQVGIWFSDTPGQTGASMYATGGAIYPVYLRILDYKRTNFNQMTRTAARLSGEEYPDVGMARPRNVEPYRDYLKEQGYDALQLIHDPVADNNSTEFRDQNVFVVFDAEQIKSALGNSGAFNPDSPSISDASTSTPKRQREKLPDAEFSP